MQLEKGGFPSRVKNCERKPQIHHNKSYKKNTFTSKLMHVKILHVLQPIYLLLNH